MPTPTPFHPRTSELCTSLRWKEWAGCYAVCSYDTHADREYFAFRHAAGLLDVTPLYKYELRGRDAGALLARVWAKDVTKVKPGRVTYGCWTDEHGKVLDDGTVTCLDEGRYRMTSADPSFAWLERNAVGFDVEITDTSRTTAAVALQGPNARDVLCAATDDDGTLAGLKFFRHARATLDGVPVEVTRTGYTGDLGYEVWCDANDALQVWDGLMGAGRPYAIHAAGLDALDVTRIEAGFILLGVDYRSARRCFTDAQKSSPFELGLGWAVTLERDFFIGQEALRREEREGSKWALVGVEIDWLELEQLYDRFELPLELPNAAYRTPIPLYRDTQQVGYVSSGVWSPTLKRNIGIATVLADASALGTRLGVEQTVEFQRHRVTATVVEKPFFDPARKRSVPEVQTA
jgi:aminomethyltransferase